MLLRIMIHQHKQESIFLKLRMFPYCRESGCVTRLFATTKELALGAYMSADSSSLVDGSHRYFDAVVLFFYKSTWVKWEKPCKYIIISGKSIRKSTNESFITMGAV